MTNFLTERLDKVLSNIPTRLARRDTEVRDEAHEVVRTLVTLTNRKRDAAFSDIASMTGLTPRRIRSHWEGTTPPGSITVAEMEALRDALLVEAEADLARREHRVAMLRARFGQCSPARASGGGMVLARAAAAIA